MNPAPKIDIKAKINNKRAYTKINTNIHSGIIITEAKSIKKVIEKGKKKE